MKKGKWTGKWWWYGSLGAQHPLSSAHGVASAAQDASGHLVVSLSRIHKTHVDCLGKREYCASFPYEDT